MDTVLAARNRLAQSSGGFCYVPHQALVLVHCNGYLYVVWQNILQSDRRPLLRCGHLHEPTPRALLWQTGITSAISTRKH